MSSVALAIAIYAHRVRKYIGAYAAVMGGVDAIAFTGGVGENSAAIRRALPGSGWSFSARSSTIAGIATRVLMQQRVDARYRDADSRTRLLVVRADEEARDGAECDERCSSATATSSSGSPACPRRGDVMYSRCSTSLSRTR